MIFSEKLSWVLALCALFAACSGNEPYGSGALRQRGVDPAVEPRPAAASTRDDRPNSPTPLAPQVDEPQVANDTLPAAEAAPEATPAPVRDLSRELESLIGSPASCLAPRTAAEAPAELRVSLTASVMPSGAVGRGEVSASAELTKPELDCLRARLESLHLAPPIENAPRTVSGSITLNRGS